MLPCDRREGEGEKQKMTDIDYVKIDRDELWDILDYLDNYLQILSVVGAPSMFASQARDRLKEKLVND